MQTIDKYFISFPTEEAHHQTHPIGVYVALVQEVHPQVISKIHELILAGVSESIKMKRYFKHALCYKLFGKDSLPNPNNDTYFLTLDDICNHMNQEQKTLELSLQLVDQALKATEYHRLSPETRLYFQPFTKSDENESSTELLWIHQEPWQQELLIKYANTVSMKPIKLLSMICLYFL